MNLDPRELDFRHQTYDWVRERFLGDETAAAEAQESQRLRLAQADDVLALVEKLRVTTDVLTFREQLNAITSPKSSRLGLSGPNGQMVVNQIANNAPDQPAAGRLLAEVLAPPTDEQGAVALIEKLAGYFTEISTANQLQLGRAAPLASAFWALAEPDVWPALWPTALKAFEQLGWRLPDDHAGRYLAFRSMILELGTPWEVLSTLRWASESVWSAADPATRKRIDWAWELKEQGVDDLEPAFENADAILAPLRKAGDDLIPAISQALDRDVTKRLAEKRREERGEKKARLDGYVTWSPPNRQEGWQTMPGLRLWFGIDGVLVGLHPGYREKGWIDHVRALFAGESLPEQFELLDYYRVQRSQLQSATQHDFFLGRFWLYDDFDWDAAADEVVKVASSALPLLQQVLVEGPAWSRSSEAEVPTEVADDELRARFKEFQADTGYPSTDDREHQSARELMSATLAKGALDAMDVAEFRRIMNTNKYGFAGFRSVLNSTLADPDQEAVQELVTEVVGDLLYGSGEFAERLDRCPKRLKGLGQAGAMKLLAIVFPERFLPIYPLTGTAGKLSLLPILAISEVPAGSVGERAVKANDALRARLASVPELADDTWGQMRFAYWLRDQASSPESDDETQSLESRLALATEACTLPPDSAFLGQLVSLLEDKGQIVLYGPPGTGKTYLALELAAALAPDEERRALVQFHPSTAYEDFMEGFRPVLKNEGLTYQLTEGPLIEMANRAALDSRPHVLVIDEMNRANLPKVFGELLFLLEYRGRPVKLAYRANEDSFSLPENLWIIGTMNLADRSVGQIDAALRRRFAFVPFTPNDEQNGGLLRRWLEKKHLPVWPADVVDEVNSQLETDLGHADLLIGPSYFMKEGLDEERMATIWRYAIEPLMSDVFHGDEALVKKYTWTAVAKQYASYLAGGDSGTAGEPDDTTGAGSDASPTGSGAVS